MAVGEPSRAQQAAETFQPPGTSYPDATVQSLETYDCSDGSASGQQLTCGTAVVEVTDGDGEGDFVSVDLPPEVVGTGVQAGDGLVLTRAVDGGSGDPSYSFSDFQRTTPIVVLALVFVVVVGLVARLRGWPRWSGWGSPSSCCCSSSCRASSARGPRRW
ncbi:hypothetical protein ACFQX8_11375 [Klenkia terrae]|uniref:hypothetical protein n=1 Tax=Klenkia terrae TaxID=1052259 RepID=UPI00361E2519